MVDSMAKDISADGGAAVLAAGTVAGAAGLIVGAGWCDTETGIGGWAWLVDSQGLACTLAALAGLLDRKDRVGRVTAGLFTARAATFCGLFSIVSAMMYQTRTSFLYNEY